MNKKKVMLCYNPVYIEEDIMYDTSSPMWGDEDVPKPASFHPQKSVG